MSTRHAPVLETISVVVPEAAVPAYEGALQASCRSIGLFRIGDGGLWQIEGVKQRGDGEADIEAALAIAAAATGVEAALKRQTTEANGWLARVYASFPEQRIGRRFAIRGTHLASPLAPGRRTLTLDAGLAFGSGEHGSTRGCLRALERVAHRRPRRILDLGAGSGILALAAASLLHRRVLGVDIEPWSVRVAAGKRGAQRASAASHIRPRRRLVCTGGAGVGALRPRVRQYSGAAALRNGAPARAPAQVRRDRRAVRAIG